MEIVSSVMANVSSSYAKPAGHVLLPVVPALSSVSAPPVLRQRLEQEGETNKYKLPSSEV